MMMKTLLAAAAVFAVPALSQVQFTPGPDKIGISIGGKPYSTFYMMGEDVTKPYLWPVRAATGTSVTRAFPMEIVEEEAKAQQMVDTTIAYFKEHGAEATIAAVNAGGNFKDGEIYVGEMSSDGTQFKRMFVENERLIDDANNKDNGKTRIDVITATHGYLYHDADGVGRYLALLDGFRVEGTLGQDDYRLMRFARNDIKLPDNENDDNDTAAKRSAPTRVLFRNADDPVMRAEIHWRLAAPLSALVLMLLALPLSKSSPREPRYARLLVAVLAWWVFNTGLGLGRSWISQGKLAPGFGFWWVYVPTVAMAALRTHFRSAGMMCQGAHSVEQRLSMTS